MPERSLRLVKRRKLDNLKRMNETDTTREVRLARLRRYWESARCNGRVQKLTVSPGKMEDSCPTKKQQTVADKLLRPAKERKLAKLRQYSETFLDKAHEFAGLPGMIAKVPRGIGTKQEECGMFAMGKGTECERLMRQESNIFFMTREEIADTDNEQHGNQSMELTMNSMQGEFDMLCGPFFCASNTVNVYKFLRDIEAGPNYMCKSCNRMLYRKTVRKFDRNAYSVDIFTDVPSFDNAEYIYNTCHSKLIKGKIPCQAVGNKLQIDEAPPELQVLRKLESVLIAQRLVFQKIIVMPKGQQRKIKGAICNIPVNSETVCQSLPRPSEQSGIILLKLKRKLKYSGHQYCETVRPEFLRRALHFLKENNWLYQNIEINMENIEKHPLHIVENDDTVKRIVPCENLSENRKKLNSVKNGRHNELDEGQVSVGKGSDEKGCDAEEIDDPQNEYRVSVNETCLQSYVSDYPVEGGGSCDDSSGTNNDNLSRIQLAGNEVCSIAPGEGKHPVHFMQDKYCEELAFPVLFPVGRFGYQIERGVKLSPTKYFNARLLNYTGKFAANPEYLFFAQYITEQKKVQDSINIALKKVSGQRLTASEVRNMSTNMMNHLIFSDQAYFFMKNIPGSPAYWKTFLFDVVAMIKQLGPPTWWMTFSCADLRWNEIYKILSKLKGKEMSDAEIGHMTYEEKCNMLNSTPVIVAKHFQYRLECLFKDILLGSGDPVGKILYDAIRIDFSFEVLHVHIVSSGLKTPNFELGQY